MAPIELLSYAGWAACLGGAATVITFVSGVLFFTKGQPSGTINDIASVFQVLFMLPIVLALYYLSSSEAGDSAQRRDVCEGCWVPGSPTAMANLC